MPRNKPPFASASGTDSGLLNKDMKPRPKRGQRLLKNIKTAGLRAAPVLAAAAPVVKRAAKEAAYSKVNSKPGRGGQMKRKNSK